LRRPGGKGGRVAACAALGGGGGGDRSGCFGALAGWAAEVAVLQAVAVALEGEDFGVVDEPVDHRDGDGVVAEDLAPGGEWLVAGDDEARLLVAAGDEHEHQVRCLGVERYVAHLVADKDGDPLQAFELLLEAALSLCVGEQGNPLGRGAEQNALPGEACADAEGDREVGLAGPGRAGVALLMLWILCRGGCGWWGLLGHFGAWSLRCSGGERRGVRLRFGAV
jgi:hypothetical protein